MRRDTFQALADPVRRQILISVASNTMNLNQVSEKFDISRQAISKHIKILTECGLVSVIPQGRERICQLHPEKLNELSSWLDAFQSTLDQRFERLDRLLSTPKEDSLNE
jgi:DNA-binding transcriptional ArsR family regulator